MGKFHPQKVLTGICFVPLMLFYQQCAPARFVERNLATVSSSVDGLGDSLGNPIKDPVTGGNQPQPAQPSQPGQPNQPVPPVCPPGQTLQVDHDEKAQANRKHPRECDEKNEHIQICHVPPGNPEAAHTIVISRSAVDAHETHHDDYLGACMPTPAPVCR